MRTAQLVLQCNCFDFYVACFFGPITFSIYLFVVQQYPYFSVKCDLYFVLQYFKFNRMFICMVCFVSLNMCQVDKTDIKITFIYIGVREGFLFLT